MIAFDTDVLTEILLGNEKYVSRAAAFPELERAVPIIVIEEIIRSRLNVIRQSEAGTSRISIERAYEFFEETFYDFQRVQILSYTLEAELFYQQWRQQKIRVGAHDLRIAAICMAHNAKLISRNRRDFEYVPDLKVEFWS